MKKLFCYLMVALLLLQFPISNISYAEAQKNSGKDIVDKYKNSEIKDLSILFERAKNGITDIPDIGISDINKSSVSLNRNLNLKVYNYTTAQVLGEVIENNVSTKVLSVTSFAVTENIVDTSSESSDALRNSGGSYYQYNWDDSIGVKAYCTSYYTYSTVNGLATIQFISASGGWQNNDASISLSNRVVKVGSAGVTAYGKYVGSESSYNPTTNSFNYTVDYTPLRSEMPFNIGATTTVTLKRGGSTWYLNLNDIYTLN